MCCRHTGRSLPYMHHPEPVAGPYPTCTIPSPLHSGQIGRETERAVPTVPAPSQTPQLGQSSCLRNSSFSIACFFGSATICDNPRYLLTLSLQLADAAGTVQTKSVLSP